MKRYSVWVLCLILVAAMLSGCSSGEVERIPLTPSPSAAPTPSVPVVPQTPVTPVVPNEPNQPDESGKVVVEPSNPTQPAAGLVRVYTLQELVNYLNQQRERGVFVSAVLYSGTLSDEDTRLIASGTGTMYISYSSRGEEYTFTLTQYPGYRIVQAHFSGDISELSGEEVQVLNIAREMVAKAKAQTSDPFELEVLLYDMFREHTTYYGGSTKIDDPNNPPRHLTAVGAFLDRRVNCQGSADGFYVLASIAGFRVERMGGRLDGELHQFNTICLDGAWYVVDATAPLERDKGSVNMYHHFNAGVDMCGGLSWESVEEHKTLAKVSDENYYYNYNRAPKHNYQKTFTGLPDLAQAVMDEHVNNGRDVVYAMLVNQQVSQNAVGEALKTAGQGVNQRLSYTYFHKTRGNHTYVVVSFSD